MGVSVDLLWESRDNPVNATRGYYATATYRAFPRWLGSTYDWQSLYLDARAYFSLPAPHVLALWAYGWFSFGNTPYLNLPSIGSDPDARSGRGYIEGRHIGKSLLYAEAEYRFRIWDFVGGVVGVNVHSASQERQPGEPQNAPIYQYWYPAVTAGIRVLVNKPTRTNGLVEVGVGLDGSYGIYLNINENF
jgi:outer membrane protein assembly factor BamA